MGPFYAVLTALAIAIIRFSLGIGSLYAFPGGISGAIVVGLIAELISKKNDKFRVHAALFEPVGTIFIGGTISSYWSISLSATLPDQYGLVSLSLMWTILTRNSLYAMEVCL